MVTRASRSTANTRAAPVRAPRSWPAAPAREIALPRGSAAPSGWAVHTGDPHLVVEAAVTDFEAQARALRWWTGPDPDGSNVHFVMREGPDGEPLELVTEDGRTFFAPGAPDFVEFVRDADGRVTHLVDIGTDIALKVE